MNHLFSHRLEVRFRDCDPMGHVNNAVYLTYLEQARFSHWRALWGMGGKALPPAPGDEGRVSPGPAGVDVPGVILARAEIDYCRPAKYGDVLEIKLGIAAIGRTSFTYEYEIVDVGGDVIATARTVIVSFDYAAGKPTPISDAMKGALGRKLQP